MTTEQQNLKKPNHQWSSAAKYTFRAVFSCNWRHRMCVLIRKKLSEGRSVNRRVWMSEDNWHSTVPFFVFFGEEVRRGSSWLFGCWRGSRFIWQYEKSQNSRRLKVRCDQGVVCHEVKSTSLYDRSLRMHWSWLTDLQKLWSQQPFFPFALHCSSAAAPIRKVDS